MTTVFLWIHPSEFFFSLWCLPCNFLMILYPQISSVPVKVLETDSKTPWIWHAADFLPPLCKAPEPVLALIVSQKCSTTKAVSSKLCVHFCFYHTKKNNNHAQKADLIGWGRVLPFWGPIHFGNFNQPPFNLQKLLEFFLTVPYTHGGSHA